MENIISEKEKLDKLINYYKDKGLLIVGLNDSQGVNVTSTFFRKGLLEYIASALKSDELTPSVINAFSLTMNKTEHIDYFLKNNLSVEEIKLSQVYSAVSALKKVMKDIKAPQFLGEAGNLYKLVYAPKKGDENIRISTSLKEASEPIVIYSSGVNDLMRAVGANPFSIKKDFLLKAEKPNYYYTLDKTRKPGTLKKVIGSIGKNFNTILSVNPNSDIYVLGAYVPKSLQSKEMNIFRNLVISYNEALIDLCNQYGVTFIDTDTVGKKYNNSEINFHVSQAGHNALANYILSMIYSNKFNEPATREIEINRVNITDKGAEGVMYSVLHDYEKNCKKALKLDGYAREREFSIADEHRRETDIFEKVLSKKTK